MDAGLALLLGASTGASASRESSLGSVVVAVRICAVPAPSAVGALGHAHMYVCMLGQMVRQEYLCKGHRPKPW